jgi:simple sugar transport system ATP-binding protein
MVHQHFTLIPPLTVAENIVLGAEPRRGVSLDLNEAIRATERLSERYGLRVDPRARVADLSVGVQQRVEILKTLYREARILVLDEPTAVLTPQETEDLFEILKELVADGFSIIRITHKLGDSWAVLRRINQSRRRHVWRRERRRDRRAGPRRLMSAATSCCGCEKEQANAGLPRLAARTWSVVPGTAPNRCSHEPEVRAGEVLGGLRRGRQRAGRVGRGARRDPAPPSPGDVTSTAWT